MHIRQIVFAARELEANSATLAQLLALDPPFADPGVAEFGLRNAVYAFGDQFIEIVLPTRDGTTAGPAAGTTGGEPAAGPGGGSPTDADDPPKLRS